MAGGATLTLLDALEHHAWRAPEHPFVIELGAGEETRTWSYSEALADVERISAGLRASGVSAGDRVAMRLGNSWSFAAVLLASLRLGAIAVPTIVQYSAEELRYALEDCGAACLVADDELAVPAALYAPDELRAHGVCERPVVRAGDDAAIFYTSGTTSRPKGVVLTHGAILDSCLISAEGWRLRPDDRGLIVLPLFHCNALFMQLVPLLLAGATAILADRFSASGFVDTVRQQRVTLANLTAGAVRSVLAQQQRADDRDHSLRLLSFALPLRDEEIAEVERRFGVPTAMAYGLTESCCGGTRSPLHVAPRSGWQSLGTAQSGWEVAIRAEDGSDLPPGGLGEIALRGPGLMDRYWNQPDATAAAKRAGWLHTGDLGRLDDAGFLYFHSRIKDMLKPKGENVAASEIEEVLRAHPAIAEAAVVGVFDAHHEERIVAFLTAAEGAAADDATVRAHCERDLASFKVPSELRWLDELPLTSIGKVNKGALRALLS